MKPIRFDATCYRLNDQPFYLNSGELHYFRVPKQAWRERMQRFKESGGNCVATYIPWLLHEPIEGQIVFGGTDGALDLEGFLQTAQEMGLYVIARPGPYQYSELIYHGLPGWLCENYPEMRAQRTNGEPISTASISYVHPLFLEKVGHWFDHVCPILAQRTISNGGPIAFVQFDNELMGMHLWLGSADYHPVSMGIGVPEGRYPRFLRGRHGTISRLNQLYDTTYASFEDVRPIAPSDSPRPSDIRRCKDYFDFYVATVAEYAQILAGMLRERGIDTPLLHNSANPNMNAYFLEMVEAFDDSFLLGSDHYYNLGQDWAQNNPTPQYAIKVFYSNEMLRLLGFPPTVLELPSGSASDWPPSTAHDSRACYLTNLAFGMKGSNYYIFTGGPNPPGAGLTTDLYDFGAPIGADGTIRPLYHVQKEVADLLNAYPWLVEAERAYDCRVALNFDYARAHNYWTDRGDQLFSDTEAWELVQRGVLTTALCAGLSPSLCDLRQDDWVDDHSTPLIVVASASMAAGKQRRIARFVQGGGNVLILPVLPTLDEYLEPCTILADVLHSPTLRPQANLFARLHLDDGQRCHHGGAFFSTDLPPDAQVIGQDEVTGNTIAWTYGTPGEGQVIVLGWRWAHAMRDHERLLTALLKRLKLEQLVVCSNPNVWTSLRVAGNQALLFIMNLLSAPMQAMIRVRIRSSEQLTDTGQHDLGPMTVKTVEIDMGLRHQ